MNEHDKMLRRLYLATNRIDGGYYFFARGVEVKENVLALLYALNDGQSHTQAEIARDWLVPKTTVNTNIKELKAAGYVEFLPGQVGREKALILTEAGRAYATRVQQGMYEAERTALERTLERFSPEFVDAMDYFADCICEELRRHTSERGET